MTDFQQLRAAAENRRDLDHEKINREFHYALMTIKALERQFRADRLPRSKAFDKQPRRILPADPNSPFRLMTTIQAADTLLREGRPMTMVELVISMMERGHRQFDQPRKVLNCLRTNMKYHAARYRQDSDGRWSIAVR